MAVDTAWAVISMGAVISMRGTMSPAVAIAVFNQLEEVNQLVGSVTLYCLLLLLGFPTRGAINHSP